MVCVKLEGRINKSIHILNSTNNFRKLDFFVKAGFKIYNPNLVFQTFGLLYPNDASTDIDMIEPKMHRNRMAKVLKSHYLCIHTLIVYGVL